MIDRLLVVAAPSGGGKTVLTRALCGGRLPELAECLGIDDPSAWSRVTCRSLKTTDTATLSSGVVFEYNIEAAWRSTRGVGLDEIMTGLLDQAREISVVTLWTPRRTLCIHRLRRGFRAGVAAREWRGVAATIVAFAVLTCLPRGIAASVARRALQRPGDGSSTRRQSGRHLVRLLRVFAHPEDFAFMYAWWLSRCGELRECTRHHLIVATERGIRFHSLESLEQMIGLASPPAPGAGEGATRGDAGHPAFAVRSAGRPVVRWHRSTRAAEPAHTDPPLH